MKIETARSNRPMQINGQATGGDGICDVCGLFTCPAWCKSSVVLGGWIGDGIGPIETVDMFETENRARRNELVDICRKCPVQKECAEYAIAAHINYGIWGGLTSAERRRIRGGHKELQEVLARG